MAVTYIKIDETRWLRNEQIKLHCRKDEVPLHKRWSFSLRISSVGFLQFTNKIINGKNHFLCSIMKYEKFVQMGKTVFEAIIKHRDCNTCTIYTGN